MKYAILAAGNGSRLIQEGETKPKPLIQVDGEALIDRILRVFIANDATEIAVICNSQMTAVSTYLETVQKIAKIPLHLMVKSTPSSMHSIWELRHWLEDAPFILTTVDTIFREQEFAEYVQAFRQMTVDGLMGVTDYPHFVSAGVYGLTPRCFETLSRCVERGEQRMRNFQRAMITDGLRLQAWPFTKVFDIDHVSDIWKAEQF